MVRIPSQCCGHFQNHGIIGPPLTDLVSIKCHKREALSLTSMQTHVTRGAFKTCAQSPFLRLIRQPPPSTGPKSFATPPSQANPSSQTGLKIRFAAGNNWMITSRAAGEKKLACVGVTPMLSGDGRQRGLRVHAGRM